LNTIYIVQFYSPAIILFFVYCKSMLQESDIVEVTNENFKKLKFKQIFDKFFFIMYLQSHLDTVMRNLRPAYEFFSTRGS